MHWDNLIIFTSFWLIGMCLAAVHAAGIVAFASFVEIRVAKVTIGGFLQVFRWTFRGVNVSFKFPIPGAVVDFVGENPDDPLSSDPASFINAPRSARAAVALGGCFALAVVAAALLGPARASASTWHGFAQVFHLPAEKQPAATLVREWATLVGHREWRTAAGVLAAKMLAFNLTPLPSLNGYAFLRQLARAPGDMTEMGKVGSSVILVSIIVLLGLSASWFVAVYQALAIR